MGMMGVVGVTGVCGTEETCELPKDSAPEDSELAVLSEENDPAMSGGPVGMDMIGVVG